MPRFSTTMTQIGNNTGIEVPAEVVEQLGCGRRPAVSLVVNGYSYRSTVGVMGGRAMVSFSSDRRKETGIAGGDAITVDIELDAAPREVVVPDDLGAALEEWGARPAFHRLSRSHRAAHVDAVEKAKAPDTRARRIAAVVAALQG